MTISNLLLIETLRTNYFSIVNILQGDTLNMRQVSMKVVDAVRHRGPLYTAADVWTPVVLVDLQAFNALLQREIAALA